MKPSRIPRVAREGTRVLFALARERLETGVVFNPMSRRFRADPYARYRRLRERDPIHRSRAVFGWVLSRHADILEVLRDDRFSADDRNFERYPQLRAEAIRNGLANPDKEDTPVMLRSDPPDHTRLRGLVSQAFTSRAVEKLEPRIDAIASELLDELTSRSAFDVIADFAVPLPVTVIAEMLGIPGEDRATFKRWSDILVGFLDPLASPGPEILRATADELFEYVSRIADVRRAKPADDLLSALVLAEQEGDRLSEDELHGTVALLLAAGNETTTNLIGNGLLALLQHPDELLRLRAEPELIDSAVEELLRYDTPVQFTARIALEDLDFHGRRFRKGQNAILALGSANRDPEVFADPDRLDVGRRENPHISFSQGAHFCLGAQLARLEGRIAFGALLKRFPSLRLGDGRLRWRKLTFLRGLAELPVRV